MTGVLTCALPICVVATGTGSNAVNVGGQEVWNFGTYVDGTSNFSKWLTLQRAPQRGSAGFALETVSQVQIITNQFSAEFGAGSATPSGSPAKLTCGFEKYCTRVPGAYAIT